MELHLRICTSTNKLRHFTGCLDGFVFLPFQVSQTEQVYRFKISSSGLPAKAETRHTTNHHTPIPKLQALVYDILPSTTAVFSYAIGSRKLSANEQFFVGAQTVVSLLQTTQIISHVCFITDHVAYASSNKTRIIWIETELFFFLPGVDAPHVYVRAWALGCFHSLIGTRTFRRALTASVDSCAEIKSAPSVA